MRDLFTNFYVIWALLVSFILNVVSFDKFNDNILFGVTWAGPLSLREGQVTPDGKDYISSRDSVFITTNNNEKYRCLLPSEQIKNKLYSGEDGYGPSPEQLLAPLADEARCSYRLEAYWTYELCHGKHVRQFHDERTQKGVKLQEYFLGKAYIPDKKDERASEPKPIPEPPTNQKDEKNKPRKPPTRKLEGRDMPYFEVVMGNGTKCDLLSGKPREIHVLYFCHPQGNNEILSVKEMSTCVYEMEVISPHLCSNEFYRFEEDPVHEISCHSLDGSADRPQSYTQFLEDQDLDRSGERQTMLFEQGKPEQDEPEEPTQSTPIPKPVTPKVQVPLPDEQLTKDFLNGDYCLQGGTGWWKYELCYGKKVIQFHVDEEHGGRTDILLGKWNKEEHIRWIRSKKTKPIGSYAVHLYSGGDTCDLTGKPRQVQVRLRCKESTHLQEVSLYLMEPEICQYILGVESPIICPLLERMDQDGLFH